MMSTFLELSSQLEIQFALHYALKWKICLKFTSDFCLRYFPPKTTSYQIGKVVFALSLLVTWCVQNLTTMFVASSRKWPEYAKMFAKKQSFAYTFESSLNYCINHKRICNTVNFTRLHFFQARRKKTVFDWGKGKLIMSTCFIQTQ